MHNFSVKRVHKTDWFSYTVLLSRCHLFKSFLGKSILQVPNTGTRVLDNTRPFLCSSIVSFWITLACSKERKDHIFGQYWYTKYVPVLTNTGTFQYLGPEVYFFPFLNIESIESHPRFSRIARSYSPFHVLKEQHECWMNTYFKISLQMYRVFFKQ